MAESEDKELEEMLLEAGMRLQKPPSLDPSISFSLFSTSVKVMEEVFMICFSKIRRETGKRARVGAEPARASPSRGYSHPRETGTGMGFLKNAGPIPVRPVELVNGMGPGMAIPVPSRPEPLPPLAMKKRCLRGFALRRVGVRASDKFAEITP